MNTTDDNTRRAIDIFKSELVEGNHDTITLFGNQAQLMLRDYSSTVSKLLQRNNDDLELAIGDAVSGIERLNLFAIRRKWKLFGTTIYFRTLSKEYQKISLYIERVSEMLKLQQAQILKEVKLLEKLAVSVDESTTYLETCINTAKSFISSRNPVCRYLTNQFPLCSSNLELDEIDNWYLRLDRRINDLCITHTIALQNKTQIQLLKNSNLTLLDIISSALSNTLPLWQNQMATILSVKRLKMRLKENERMAEPKMASLNSMNANSENYVKEERNSIEIILDSNKKLKDSLTETALLEKQDHDIRENIKTIN